MELIGIFSQQSIHLRYLNTSSLLYAFILFIIMQILQMLVKILPPTKQAAFWECILHKIIL